jgi:hypothetical protein
MWGNNSLPLLPEHSATSKKNSDTPLHSGGSKFVSESSVNTSPGLCQPHSLLYCQQPREAVRPFFFTKCVTQGHCQYRSYIASMKGWLMNMEHLVEWKLAGETEVLGENLPQFDVVHHKSRMTRGRIRTTVVGSQLSLCQGRISNYKKGCFPFSRAIFSFSF